MNAPAPESKVTFAATTAAQGAPRARKPYSKPVLEALGDIRDLTLGGSLGTGESGPKGKTRKP